MIKKLIRQIPILLILLILIGLIGVSNYFFASSSFHLTANPQAGGAITRQWVGNTDGLYMTLILGIVAVFFWLTGVFTGRLDKLITRSAKFTKERINYIKNNPVKVIIHAGILISIVITATVIVSLTVPGTSIYGQIRLTRFLFFTAVGLSVYFIVLSHSNVQRLFVLLSLIIGLVYVTAHPHFFFSWDSNAHYAWSFEQSFVRYASANQADIALSNNLWIPFSSSPAYDGYWQFMSGDELATVRQYRLGSYTVAAYSDDRLPLYSRIAYIPAGLALYIGRSLALAPLNAMRLGMFANHLMYITLVYFAIKRLNSGKHIMAIIAMFPTAFVLSNNYSHDYWVTGFAMLGFAYYFNEIQNPDEKIKRSSIIVMIGSFVIGMAPKAIYFFMMGILYFIKRSKFRTKKGYLFYLLAVTIGILIISSSFLIPNLTGNTGPGDLRGGDEVGYGSQISFILDNPLTYAKILLGFLWGYFNVFTETNYVTGFAGFGAGSYYYLSWLLLLFVMFTDRNEKDLISIKAGHKTIVAVIAFGTVVLFTTAMYIVYTPVGADFIHGVQGRYMLPVLFPVLYVLGGFKLQNNINKTAYTAGVFGIMCLVLLTGVWERLIVRLG